MLTPVLGSNDLCTDCVHIVYVSRGREALQPALRSASNVHSWTAARRRLRFHILAGEACLKQARKWLHAWPYGMRVFVYNASDASLRASLSQLGQTWLALSAKAPDWTGRKISGKVATYMVPKLFMFELLAVPQALILDSDTFVMGDLAMLWDEWSARRLKRPSALLGYAHEHERGVSGEGEGACGACKPGVARIGTLIW